MTTHNPACALVLTEGEASCNCIKYLWRQGLKGNSVEDLRKAAWYVNRQIEKMSEREALGGSNGDNAQ